jgi:hypothetical protein
MARIAAGVALAALLGACAQPGDFGRVQHSVMTDTIRPAAGKAIAENLRSEPVSDFNLTDREAALRERAWTIVLPPHARDWFGAYLVEGQRTRILPELDDRYDPTAYYKLLRTDAFRSSEARWSRLIEDMRADTTLVRPFCLDARLVRGDDQRRLRAIDGRPDVSPKELQEAYDRVEENGRVVDWVWRMLRFRAESYRIAIDRMMVETPTDRLAEVTQFWQAFVSAIADNACMAPSVVAQGGRPALPSRLRVAPPPPEQVPQK